MSKWTPVPDIDGTPESPQAAIAQALGAASMCWISEGEPDHRVFDSTKCRWVLTGLLDYLGLEDL